MTFARLHENTSSSGSSSIQEVSASYTASGGDPSVIPVWAQNGPESCSGCSSDHPCQACSHGIQRNAVPGTRSAPVSEGGTLAQPAGRGTPLAPYDLTRFSAAFGRDLSRVRLHTGGEASALARAQHALAYTTGSDIVLGSSYAPGSTEGRRLLAHELVHVVQQRQGRAGGTPASDADALFENEADRGAELAMAGHQVGPLSFFNREAVQLKPNGGEPPDSIMTASLAWFVFDPVKGATYDAGDEGIQLWGMVLKKLLGPRYTLELRDKIVDELPSRNWVPATGTAKAGDPFTGVMITPKTISKILAASAKQNAPITLAAEKQRYLALGLTADQVYQELRDSFPRWLTREIFEEVVAQHTTQLQQISEGKADASDIGREIADAVDAVDAIRADTALVSHDGYAYLWPRDKNAPASVAAADRAPRLDPAAWLILYAEARPNATAQAARSVQGAAARKSLLDGFVAGYDMAQLQPTKKGDQALLEFPSTYTAPPYPSTLTVYPQPDYGWYGSTRGEYGFEMSLQFPNIWSTFQFHHYDFTAIRVPDDNLINAATALKGPGRSASRWGLLKGRLARDKRYQEADVHAYLDGLSGKLGPPGLSLEPLMITAGLRYAGTVIGSLIEWLADPSDVARFRFPDEGLYIVRCVATWGTGNEELALKRPPSVAWVPLFARSPELLAEQHLQALVGEQDEARRRVEEIDKTLPGVQDAGRKTKLEDERRRLAAGLGGVEGLLTYQREMFAKSGEQGAEDRVKQIDRILGTRQARGFDKDTERLPATFVNDAGQLIDLLIEVKVTNRKADDPDYADYAVNDATTPGSVSARRTGRRHEAIVAALQAIFKDSDYGRGRATVLLDNQYVPIDISTVSSGKMFMEALANTATILSIVAIALAVPTGGESMVLMMPAMIIGAVPSAYNIIKRGVIDHTLNADLALAMDIVNVVGAALGIGAETRAGLQAVRLGTASGKVLVVLGVGTMGTGVLVMGASVLDQLESVKTMPEGLQEAEVAKILSQAMVQSGIMMGQLLAAHLTRGAGRGPSVFEDWLSGIDEKNRSALEQTKTEKDPARNLWRLWAEMDPLVRDLLTHCSADCIPGTAPSKRDQVRIKTLSESLGEQAYRTLQGLLHDNREPAAFERLLSDLEAARTAAPRSKGSVKKIAAVESAILGRGTVANDLLAKLSEEAVNTRAGPPDPQRWQRTVQLAQEVGTAGKIPLDVLRRVIDHLRTIRGANPEEILLLLDRLADIYGKVPGVDDLLNTRGLTGSYTDFEGARWVLQFLEDNALWDQVKAFEEKVPGTIERVVDVRLTNGDRIELKSWEKWHTWADASFAHQIMADYFGSSGFTSEAVKWVFESGGKGGVESPETLINKMNAALDQALAEGWPHYDDAGAAARVARIKAKLPDIVRVGKL
jgi:hypothetical protein